MKDRLRRLKGRVHEGLENFRTKSDQSELPAVHDQVPGRIKADFQQLNTQIPRPERRPEETANPGDASSSLPQSDTNKNATTTFTVENIDISSWANVWSEAYENVKTDPDHSKLLQKLERFLESEGRDVEALDDVKPSDDPSATNHDSRLNTIQRNAEERLEKLSDAHLSFKIRNQPVIVRESILKAVQVINKLKPVITGAVAAEPSAALAWAGVTTILPILENIFQQDEDAATGLTNIIFLMVRYQGFHERDFASQLESSSWSGAPQELLSRVKNELVSLYSKIYVYEARFILQYGKRNKAHRALRNALSADDWKKSWLDIESISNRIDKGMTAQVNVATLKTWKVVNDVQEQVERLETMQHYFDRRQLLQSLQVTGNASYDSYRSSRVEAPCLPGTQRHILQVLQEWTEDSHGEMILWLEGMAGTGKTSIALTVASALEAREPFTDTLKRASKAFLGASFFFSQGDTTRNNTFELFRTIAWCLADISPEFGLHVTNAIRDNPGIQTKVPLQQLQKLIIGPLTLLDESKFVPLLLIVVIDALDECEKEDAQDLLGMLVHLQSLHQIQLRFLITSRPEEHIAMSFEPLFGRLCRRIQLKKVKSATDGNSDIVYYLSQTLQEVAKTQGVADDGVSSADIMKLADKADGLFIYAATACRFLTPNFAHKALRDEHLNLIFDGEIEEDGPQHKVDEMYFKVLAFPDIQKSHKRVQTTFYAYISRLIGFIVVLFRPASVETLFHLLHTATPDTSQNLENTARRDLEGYLRRLYSIINVPREPGLPLSLVHLSFRDFILNESRSERLPFSITEHEMHHELFHRCMDLMDYKLCQDICQLVLPGTLVSEIEPGLIASHIPQYLRYASRYWVSHLSQVDRKYLVRGELADDGIVHKFLRGKLLCWLEVMALIGEASSIIPMISQLESLIQQLEKSDLSSLVYDVKRFILSNTWIIEHAPLQIYCSSLLFSPKESLVRLHYQSQVPQWIVTRPEAEDSWSCELLTLQGHTGNINDTTFSPTECLLASVSSDNTTRVWDYITGSEIYSFEDPGDSCCVCFSIDGLRVATGCVDGAIRVRDIKKGTDWSFHCASRVTKLSFSPASNNVLASISEDAKLRIWDVDSGKVCSSQYDWGQESLKRLTFSPDGQFVAVHQSRRIAIYDVELVEVVQQFRLLDDTREYKGPERIVAIQYSHDSEIIAVRMTDCIEFWNINTPVPQLMRSYEATWAWHSSFLYLPEDENISFSSHGYDTVELFDASQGDSIGRFSTSTKSRSRDGTALSEIGGYHPAIRIYESPPAARLLDKEHSGPRNVELVIRDSVALSYGNGKARKWSVKGSASQPFHDEVRAIRYAPDRQFILVQLNNSAEFQVWDRTLTRQVATFEQMAGMAFVPETGHLVSLSLFGDLQIRCYDPTSLDFNVISGFSLDGVAFQSITEANLWLPARLHLSPNGEQVAILLDEHKPHSHRLQLWNMTREERIMDVSHPLIHSIVFSLDSGCFVVEYGDNPCSTQLLQISNGTIVDCCDFSRGSCLTFHPLDQRFGIVSENNTISVWDGMPWAKEFMLKAADDLRVQNLAFSTTNKLVALSGRLGRPCIIEVWDTATRQKIGSQNLAFTGFAISLSFSKNGNSLESNRGRLPVPTQVVADTGPDSPGDGIHDCLYVLDDWVYQGYERLIWIPPSYRPPTHRSRNIDVQDGMIALAYERNCVKFIGVSLKDTPVAKHYLGLGLESR